MKVLRYILCGVLIIAVLGLLGYQYFIEKNLDSSHLTKAVILILGAVLSMFRKPNSRIVHKKSVYEKAYSEYIQNAFHDSPKLEKQFYDAIHYYNLSKYSKAVTKLDRLSKECQRTNERRAVAVFTALCLDEMQLYDQAITQYQSAIHMQYSSSLQSNMGLCYQKSGDFDSAQKCYQQAIQADPKNGYAMNNLSALYFRQGNYKEALELAESAIEVERNLRPALTTAAICCGILGYTEEYEQYYRQAVANGADGRIIKDTIRNMDPNS